MIKKNKIISDYKIALQKAGRYCAHEEKSIFDLKSKLKSWNVDPSLREEIIDELKKQNYINEERYAKVFTSGKVRIKKWGRIKIANQLRAKNISEDYIDKALRSIDEEKYSLNLQHLISQKRSLVKGKTENEKKMKLIQFLIAKGYEQEQIYKEINRHGNRR
jgi:regulatory protein